MLARLHSDHKHIAILLKLLNNKQERLEKGEVVNFNLIRDVVEYMQSYAEHSHHPLEDLINDFYSQAYPAEMLDRKLAQEHETLSENSSQLMATLNLILSDVPVQIEQLNQTIKDYVSMQKAHMLYEEEVIFPMWQQGFSEQDWQVLNAKCQERLISDPLFSDDDNLVFEELREYIAKAEE
ncbi:hemerythrin domain-containing protein [Shewanella sp. AS1]|uniref:hemerythrin domain-containing protein n=1 Tax=Shewanella sp. AS1 TaxID=2907626 RepID=UPI001F41C3E6|nr:hemerythrin domain-containing protein [Shewanella sp. AS1]MCE9677993.1 hemerythrin domain-containing protein [Shewanella sp. AS1]